MVNLKVKESLNKWTFWLLLNLICAEIFLIFFHPLSAIPNLLLGISYIFRQKEFDEREELLKFLDEKIKQLEQEDEGKK